MKIISKKENKFYSEQTQNNRLENWPFKQIIFRKDKNYYIKSDRGGNLL